MAFSFVQAIKTTFAAGSPRTQVIPSTVFGNVIVVFFNEGTVNSINTVTLAGVAMTLVAGPTSGTNGVSANFKSIYAAPVPIGGGNITLSWSSNGVNNNLAVIEECGGLAVPINALATGNTVANAGTSASYNLSPNPSILSQVFNFCERTAGGPNWSGLSGTDRTGVTAQIVEANDQPGIIGTNTATATSSVAGFGMQSVALALAAVVTFSGKMLTGKGV